MSLLSTLKGQPIAQRTLEQALMHGNVHHAYLFDGPDGVGKELAAFGLAQALVCEHPTLDRLACGVCSACMRVPPRGEKRLAIHPDVVVLERGLYEPPQIGRRAPEVTEISIDQVRTLVLSRSQYSAHEGRARVFIVRRVDELSIAAANALLKTLEEPQNATHFVLLTTQIGSLLPTIRSRTQRVRFGTLPVAIMHDLLIEQGVARTDAARIASLADGSMSRAHALRTAEGDAMSDLATRARAAVDSPTLESALAIAEDLKRASRDDARRAVDQLAHALSVEARMLVGTHEGDRAARRYEDTQQAIKAFDQNGSVQLVTEILFINLQKA